MAIKIEQKIVGYKVRDDSAANGVKGSKSEQPATAEVAEGKTATAEVIHMHERVERPDMLVGSTYKIKTPLSEHALYVTINDVILNPGTEHELRRPFEIFINSKNMEHFQWIVALTLIISAVFRKGGDVTFLVDELRSVFDPKGGYFKKGGRYMPSLVAEIGDAIESHLRMIGLMKGDELDAHQQVLIATKRREFLDASRKEQRSNEASDAPDIGLRLDAGLGAGNEPGTAPGGQRPLRAESDEHEETFPQSAQLCTKCSTKAVIKMDGCMTCLSCGDSKCG